MNNNCGFSLDYLYISKYGIFTLITGMGYMRSQSSCKNAGLFMRGSQLEPCVTQNLTHFSRTQPTTPTPPPPSTPPHLAAP
jgi:hypothetical protein